MEKIMIRLVITFLDSETGTGNLLPFDIPLAIIIGVILIAFITVILILRARKKNRIRMITGNADSIKTSNTTKEPIDNSGDNTGSNTYGNTENGRKKQ